MQIENDNDWIQILNRFIDPNAKNNKTSEMQIASILLEEQVIRLILWDMPSSNSQHTKIKGTVDGVFIAFDLTTLIRLSSLHNIWNRREFKMMIE